MRTPWTSPARVASVIPTHPERPIRADIALPEPASTTSARGATIALLVPGGRDHAGGIGRWAGYLLDSWRAQQLQPKLELIDTRGHGHPGRAAWAFGRALARLLVLRATGRLAGVHANLSTRGSTVRKWGVSHLAAALRVPLVLHLHGSGYDAFYAALPGFWQRRIAAMFGRADRVIVLGQGWADWVTQTLPVPADRVRIVHNGVPAPVRRQRRPGPCRILLLGRLGARKGVPELLAALADPALRARAWTATLAGDGEVDRFRATVAASALSDRVALPGWLGVDAAADALGDADILVLPSHAENFPISVIEALAAGVAVVATPVGATPELLEDGVSALLVPVGDVAALVAALARLIDDEALRARIAAAGHAVFERRLDIDALARRIATLHATLDATLGPVPC